MVNPGKPAPLRPVAFLLWLHARMRTERHSVIAVEGDYGAGKSVTTLGLASTLGLIADVPFNVERDVFVTRDQYYNALRGQLESGEERRILQVDEGANFAYIGEHMTKENRRIKKLHHQVRILNDTEFWCIRSLRLLDREIRDETVNARVQVEDRSRARILSRWEDEWGEVKWHRGPWWDVPDVPAIFPEQFRDYRARSKPVKHEAMTLIMDAGAKKEATKDAAPKGVRRKGKIDSLPGVEAPTF